MAGDKDDTAVGSVQARLGYRVSRAAAPAGDHPPTTASSSTMTPGSHARISRAKGESGKPGGLRGDNEKQHTGGRSDHDEAKGGGRGRRNKRGGGGRKNSGSEQSKSAGTPAIDSGRLDLPSSPRPRQQSQRPQQQPHQRGGGAARQAHPNSAARDRHEQGNSRQRPPAAGSSNRAAPGGRDNATTNTTSSRIGSPPASPRNALFRGNNERQQRASARTFDDARGAGRQVSRALRGALHLSPRREEQPRLGDKASHQQERPRTPTRDSFPGGDARHRHPPSPPPPTSPPQQQQRQEQQRELQQQKKEHPEHARGVCMSMCPVEEMRLREAEGGLNMFEATEETARLPFRERVADPTRTVKKYRRSAAGRDMRSPEQLRPLSVLHTTARYLAQDVFATACMQDSNNASGKDTEAGATGGAGSRIVKAYLFVEDRLRAVRQDLTVQGVAAAPGAAEVLKTAANFYIVSGYLMCDQPADVFDKHLHTRELQGVFSSLAELFFQAKGVGRPRELSQTPGEDEYLCLQAVHAMATAISNDSKGDAQLNQAASGQGIGRVFTSTVSKLCDTSARGLSSGTNVSSAASGTCPLPAPPASSTGTAVAIERVADPPLSFKQAFPKMATAIRLLGAVEAGNWSEFHRLLGRTSGDDRAASLVGDGGAESPFAIRIRCLSHGMLLPVRVHALRALNKSYGKGEKVPLVDISKTLRMRSNAHAAGLCRALSLPVEDEAVAFKSVPVAWKTEEAKRLGFLAPPGQLSDTASTPKCPLSSPTYGGAREDNWVGLERVFASGEKESSKTAGGGARHTCDACGGYGCVWCEGGVAVDWEGREEEAGLWEVALAPG